MLSTSALIWLILFAFACNDGEELLTAATWIRRNPERYNAMPRALRLDLNKPLTAQFAVAVVVVGSALLAFTIIGAQTYAATGRLHPLFIAALVMIFLDGVKHILIAIGMRGYSSGVISAALVQVPYGFYALHRFLATGLVTWSEIVRYGAIGVIVIGPVLMLGFALGRWIVPTPKAPVSA